MTSLLSPIPKQSRRGGLGSVRMFLNLGAFISGFTFGGGGIRHGSGDFFAKLIFLVGFFREASGDPGWFFFGRGTRGVLFPRPIPIGI